MTKWELTDLPLTPRTNGTVFLYQDKIYIIGGKWQNPSVQTKTDIPIPHDIVYFQNNKAFEVKSINQQQFWQDRYSFFIYPEGTWAEWNEWAPCDASCGKGKASAKSFR